ncbi:MAG: GMC family oxidoreductase [Methylobacter sp.]|nr:GMC family oxidoreductase [Methylobacter sp.]
MNEQHYDAIIIGSGAGGSACAYNLVQAGKRVLLLEKGGHLPTDGSTLDVQQVFVKERFKNKEPWRNANDKTLTPGEYYNVGGKTKWYGAVLLRFAPHEFVADPDFQCLGWPISYADLEPFYTQAEQLLQINHFDHEPQLGRFIKRITQADKSWRVKSLPLGLKKDILDHTDEAKHFDGFASPGAYKADAEQNLLSYLADNPLFQLLPYKEVSALLSDKKHPAKITGVSNTDGENYYADTVILAAGAMSSPRILQKYLQQNGLDKTLPSAPLVGAHFKLHLNSALLGFSLFPQRDVLRKTAIFFNEAFPHSSVQCLGWMDGEMLSTQLPKWLPAFVTNALGARAYGFFVTTEDGSSPDNRIIGQGDLPKLDYKLKRIPASVAEHRSIIRGFKTRLLQAGFLSVSQQMGLDATAHALGSMVTGNDPASSVVDAYGKVHGFDNLYVADGSVLPRSSRVNPGLTIYAWGLRLGRYLAAL